MMVGAIAGSTEAIIFYPLTFTRTRLGVDIGKGKKDRQFKNTYDWFYKICKTDGVRGLYRGVLVSLILISLTKSTYFGFYESAKKNLDGYKHTSYHLILIWMLATLTTAAGYLLFYPLDTVRRRMMMQSGRNDILYKGSIDWAKKIFIKEGPRGFFKGLIPQLTKSVGTSVFLVINEGIQRNFN